MRFLALLLLLVGCHPCVERCRPLGGAYAECMSDWGLEWADLGASDETTFRQACERDQGAWVDGLSGESSDTATERCIAQRDELRAATTCEERWAILEGFGTP